jgi:aspartyl-tRNA(Asn)/glutamyl-tRNA(Gln) amidotransferase subunit C
MKKLVSPEEVKKLAYASRIHLCDEEILEVQNSIDEILNYVQILNQVDTTNIKDNLCKNINVVRIDQAELYDTEKILKNAPQEVHNSFVVPAVIKKNK